jgi:hypothetical protein
MGRLAHEGDPLLGQILHAEAPERKQAPGANGRDRPQ